MEKEYYRDLHRNYLVLKMKMNNDRKKYQISMLTHNQVPGLLPCKIEWLDNSLKLNYEITGLETLAEFLEYRKLDEVYLKKLMYGILQMSEQSSIYLLDFESFFLDSEYIYVDEEMRRVYFCCLPGRNSLVKEEFHQLMEYLVGKIDHSREQAVLLAYELYKKSMRDNYSVADIVDDFLEQQGADEIPPAAESAHLNEGTEEKIIPEQQPERRSWLIKAGVIIILLEIGAILYVNMPLDSWFLEELDIFRLSAVLAVIAAVIIYVYVRRRRAVKEPVTAAEDYQCETDNKTVLLTQDINPFCKRLISRNEQSSEDICIWGEQFVIGKNETADCQIDIKSVSRTHCRIKLKKGKYYIEDMGSLNGTYVNGKRLKSYQEVVLKDKCKVAIGELEYEWKE